MHIGFSGSQKGMTQRQKDTLAMLLFNFKPNWDYFHHGDCIGADAEAHDIAVAEAFTIIIHPPDDDKKRAFKEGFSVMRPRPYLERNKDIVMSCQILIAAPETMFEEQRSGTWATTRFAQKSTPPIIILAP